MTVDTQCSLELSVLLMTSLFFMLVPVKHYNSLPTSFVVLPLHLQKHW